MMGIESRAPESRVCVFLSWMRTGSVHKSTQVKFRKSLNNKPRWLSFSKLNQAVQALTQDHISYNTEANSQIPCM